MKTESLAAATMVTPDLDRSGNSIASLREAQIEGTLEFWKPDKTTRGGERQVYPAAGVLINPRILHLGVKNVNHHRIWVDSG